MLSECPVAAAAQRTRSTGVVSCHYNGCVQLTRQCLPSCKQARWHVAGGRSTPYAPLSLRLGGNLLRHWGNSKGHLDEQLVWAASTGSPCTSPLVHPGAHTKLARCTPNWGAILGKAWYRTIGQVPCSITWLRQLSRRRSIWCTAMRSSFSSSEGCLRVSTSCRCRRQPVIICLYNRLAGWCFLLQQPVVLRSTPHHSTLACHWQLCGYLLGSYCVLS